MDTTCFCWLVSLKLADRFNYGPKKRYFWYFVVLRVVIKSRNFFSAKSKNEILNLPYLEYYRRQH